MMLNSQTEPGNEVDLEGEIISNRILVSMTRFILRMVAAFIASCIVCAITAIPSTLDYLSVTLPLQLLMGKVLQLENPEDGF